MSFYRFNWFCIGNEMQGACTTGNPSKPGVIFIHACIFFSHIFYLFPSVFFSTLFVFYSFESQLKCINFIDSFIWNALVNKLHKWHGQDDYDDVDVVNSDYHVYSCTHRHSNYNVLYRKIASIVIIIRTFLLLHFLEYLYSVCTRSIAMPCTALHCTALHCTPIEWQFCNLRTSICYYLDCKLQMINLTSELPVNACIHAPLEHCSTYKNWSFIYLCKLIACCSTGKYVCMYRTAYTIWC